MPVAPTYPGVYIEEVPSDVRTIVGASTSIAAFIDWFPRGPMNQAVEILSMADFQRIFGGLASQSEASYAIGQFFLNGGTRAYVIRVASGAPARANSSITGLRVDAANEGDWGENVHAQVIYRTADLFDLVVTEWATRAGRLTEARQESYPGVSRLSTVNEHFVRVVDASSELVTVTNNAAPADNLPAASGTLSGALGTSIAGLGAGAKSINVALDAAAAVTVSLGDAAVTTPAEAAAALQSGIRAAQPTNTGFALAQALVVGQGAQTRIQVVAGPGATPGRLVFTHSGTGPNVATALSLTAAAATSTQDRALVLQNGADGGVPNAPGQVVGMNTDPPTGMFSLEKVDEFNILCIPCLANTDFTDAEFDSVVSSATTYCQSRRAMLIIDPPRGLSTVGQIRTWMAAHDSLRDDSVAVYFPRVQYADPLNDSRLRSFGPSGTMAGVWARTDSDRGVWKAPAGTAAVLRGVSRLDATLSDAENGVLNPLAINVLRTFPGYGHVSWGARTLIGSDAQASPWRYIAVRRLANYIEQSLFVGTKWVVFEPNDEPLWAQLRLNVGAFMHRLFLQGALQGQSARAAYLVKCDAETTPQADRDLGIVNILVGFAPLRPAEFVILRIQQLAGQLQA